MRLSFPSRQASAGQGAGSAVRASEPAEKKRVFLVCFTRERQALKDHHFYTHFDLLGMEKVQTKSSHLPATEKWSCACDLFMHLCLREHI